MRFFILIFLAILFSCRSNRSGKTSFSVASQSPECEELIDFIDASWRKNREGFFYFKNQPENYNKVHYSKYMENCLKGRTKKEIEKLFDLPSAQALNRYYYYMSAECAKGKPPGNFDRKCMLLIIYFDNNDRVRTIPAIMNYRAPVP